MNANQQLELILGNARRLFADAELLFDHQRYASAFALAVLGLEEIGKALLKYWNAQRPLPNKANASAHIRKQAAVSSLLLGALVVRRFPNGVDLDTVDFSAVTREFNDSEEGRVFMAIQNRDLDRRKQNALYQDDDLLTAVEDDFAEKHVGAIFNIALEAQKAAINRIAQIGGRAFYELF